MTRKKPTTGGTIDARCTRCRELTNHTIVAMVEERVVRVECNTCGSVHNYKPAVTAKTSKTKTPKSPNSTAPRATKVSARTAQQEEWESRCGACKEAATPYSMTKKFTENEILEHSTFGLGVIKKALGQGKIEVLFRDGIKLLKCGM